MLPLPSRREEKRAMTNHQAAEILRDIGEALAEGPTIQIRAVRATLRALAIAVVALESESAPHGLVADAELTEK